METTNFKNNINTSQEVEQNNENNSVEVTDLLNHVRQQINQLHFSENDLTIEERELHYVVLSETEKKLLNQLKLLKIKEQFKKWATEPMWKSKKVA